MNPIDIIILVLLLIGAYSGYKQGLFIGILSVVAFVVGLVFAFRFMHWGAEMLAERVESLTFMLPFVSFLVIFLMVTITVRVLAYLVKKTLDLTIFGTFDNFAGAVLGMVKWGFMISLLIWLAASFEMTVPQEMEEGSALLPVIRPVAPFIIELLDAVTPVIQEAVEAIQKLVDLSEDAVVD